MKHEITCAWKGGMGFEADVNGHAVAMDAGPDFGGAGSGPSPKPLLLAALAGCTGMDIVSLLRKMREPLTWFNMLVAAELSDEHPKRYTSFSITFQFKASDGLGQENVQKAVTLSQEKYCGVAAMLRAAGPLAWSIEYL